MFTIYGCYIQFQFMLSVALNNTFMASPLLQEIDDQPVNASSLWSVGPGGKGEGDLRSKWWGHK